MKHQVIRVIVVPGGAAAVPLSAWVEHANSLPNASCREVSERCRLRRMDTPLASSKGGVPGGAAAVPIETFLGYNEFILCREVPQRCRLRHLDDAQHPVVANRAGRCRSGAD